MSDTGMSPQSVSTAAVPALSPEALQDLQALFTWQPARIAQSDPGDLPLLYWMVGQIRPERVLCLGVGEGDAHVTLCEAARDAGLSARIFGIDTWAERDDASLPGVPAELAGHVRDTHPDLSRLICADPDDATEILGPDPLDILLVDQMLSAERVARIVSVWAPRMSQRGAIILRGIARNQGMPAPAPLDDLRARWPHLTFMQGKGVLVLLTGNAPPAALASLCRARPDGSDAQPVLGLLHWFGAALGARQERMRLRAEVSALEAAHVQVLTARDATIADLTRAAASQAAKLAETEAQLTERTQDLASLTRYAEVLHSQLSGTGLRAGAPPAAAASAEAEKKLVSLRKEASRRVNELKGTLAKAVAQRDTAVAQRNEAREAVSATRAEAARRVNELKETLAKAVAQRDEAQEMVLAIRSEASRRVNELKETLAKAIAQRDEAREKLRTTKDAAEAQKKALTTLRIQSEDRQTSLEQELATLRSSTSWRVTAPIRSISSLITPSRRTQ